MEIKLLSLTLNNFKGARYEHFDFTSKESWILGQNGIGKSTLMDAFLYALFGKDSSNQSDFNIKTLDENNNPINRLDHEVIIALEVNGSKSEFKRIYKEKWVKPTGSNEVEFKGHTTDFYIDNVPLNKTEYEKRISNILDENLFRLITNPMYFNSLKKEAQREMLIQMAENYSQSDVYKTVCDKLGESSQLKALIAVLDAGKDILSYEKETKATMAKIDKDMKDIPSRIDEQLRTKPESENWKELESEKEAHTQKANEIENSISDLNKLDESKRTKIKDLNDRIDEFNSLIRKLENEAQVKAENENALALAFPNTQKAKKAQLQSQLTEHKYFVSATKGKISYAKTEIETLKETITKQLKDRESLLSEYETERTKAFEFNDSDTNCPTCQRPYEGDVFENKKETLRSNFNADKLAKLKSIEEKGMKLKKVIQENEAEKKSFENIIPEYENQVREKESLITSIESEISELENSISSAQIETFTKADFIDSESVIGYEKRISELKEEIEAERAKNDSERVIELRRQKNEILESISKINERLAKKNQIQTVEARIEELKKQESELANEYARLQGIEFAIKSFNDTKMEMVEESVNKRFEIVKFKLFNNLINRGTELTCQAMINGVPFSDLNTAGKLNAGIDIINTLSNFHNVYAPIWLDNRESVFLIPQTNSQIINLMAFRLSKKLIMFDSFHEVEDYTFYQLEIEKEENLRKIMG